MARARVRTLATARADFEDQVRLYLASGAAMALTEPEHVRSRMKELRKLAGNPSQYDVAHDLNVPPRTFQSWENAEVETDKGNYEKVARYYTRKLKQKVTANWILFGQDEAPALSTPDLMGNGDGSQLDRIEAKLDCLLETIREDLTTIEARVARVELAQRQAAERAPQAAPDTSRKAARGRPQRRRAS